MLTYTGYRESGGFMTSHHMPRDVTPHTTWRHTTWRCIESHGIRHVPATQIYLFLTILVRYFIKLLRQRPRQWGYDWKVWSVYKKEKLQIIWTNHHIMRWELEHTIVGCNTWMEFLEERKKISFQKLMWKIRLISVKLNARGRINS